MQKCLVFKKKKKISNRHRDICTHLIHTINIKVKPKVRLWLLINNTAKYISKNIKKQVAILVKKKKKEALLYFW